ncbi:phosphatidylinositol/phosphatidylcholine transfer protein SFH11 [Andrographis paniculata]|uniref:phosphatidylinositol/phosphatidylcholine transfer protein SFH11 n=1 Tax=Andrographis paniculata TaxID=175694 RepID=UPI0021E87D18|nr:phosphatidylinositol/phosphatidylcholine transfer protein SFH11 [Andrographis paniculata]
MEKAKEQSKEILISADAGGSNQSAAASRKKTKSFHPPIETFWQLPPAKEPRRSKPRFIAILSNTFKYMEPLLSTKKSQSKRTVLEGHHDPKDQIIVDSFRELLHLEGQLPKKHFDYHTLLRFLRMRDFHLVKAKDMFMQYIKWREEFHVDTITKEFKFDEYQEVKQCYPHGFHGVDRYGRPVYIEQLGMVDLNKFLQVTTVDRFVKHHICEQEKTMNWRFPACSLAAKKHIASTFSILDVKDVGRSHFSKPARHLFMEIQRIDSCYYPETLHQLFIINAGSGFKVLWKAIKKFLDERTLAKIRVLGTDYRSFLIEAIDPSNLPTFLGGECTCSESGGCLFSDKGPWNDPEIIETLQVMLNAEEEQECGELDEQIASTSLPSDGTAGDNIDKPLLKKIQAFEPVLEAAKKKIASLETALEETKLVLQGLTQHIEELKR